MDSAACDPFAAASGPIPMDDFRRRILDLYRPPLRARTTFISIRRSLDLVMALGGVETTADLTTATIARFVNDRRGKENPNTTRTHLRKLSAACGIAQAEGWIRVNPFQVRRGWVRGVTPKAPQIHSRDDLARVLERAAAEIRDAGPRARWKARRLYALLATAAYTGMRKMEILSLRVEDVQLDRRVINLTARSEYELKTEAAAQPVPVPEPLSAVLRGWIGHVGAAAYLFPNAKGGPWIGGPHRHNATDELKALGERAGVSGLTFQSLRHSWATHAEFFGLTEIQIQRVLRHTNSKTQRFYRHPEADNMRQMVARIDFRAPEAPAAAPPESRDPAIPPTPPPPPIGPRPDPEIDPAMAELYPIPGFPRHRLGSDRTVWTNLRRDGHEQPGDPPGPWRRLREHMRTGTAVVNLRRDGRTVQRTVGALWREVFGADAPPG